MYNTILIAILFQLTHLRCWALSLTNIEKASPLKNSTHYWNLKDVINNTLSRDVQNHKKPFHVRLVNNVNIETHKQLGKIIKLDGKRSWAVIPKLSDKCITRVQCINGITVSFWMKYEGGDYIFAAGRYSVDEEQPGFRLQRDPESNFFILEVSNLHSTWKIFIKELPKNWFHFIFTWKQAWIDNNIQTSLTGNEGLKVYINGKEKLSKLIPQPIISGNSREENDVGISEFDVHRLVFGRVGSLRKMENPGKFQFGNLAIWKRVLSAEEVEKMYHIHVNLDHQNYRFCCVDIESEGCKGYDKYPDCICPKLKREEICKRTPVKIVNKACRNLIPHCDKLTRNGQRGYCDNFPEALTECYSSCVCEKVTRLMASKQPKQYFSQASLIIALLGCIGGLILLFGIMFYFWKIYRTRYHGAFVPPLKSVSLLDVPEYEDEKWPSKYIDSAAFYIKDVPPKKRALPLIPAKHSQSNYRYQPPEFD